MRAICITLFVALVLVCGLAYWLDWWHISAVPNTEPGKSAV